MLWLYQSEITSIKCVNARNCHAFGNRHLCYICNIQFCIMILLHEFNHTLTI